MSVLRTDVSSRAKRLVKDVSGMLDADAWDDCIDAAADYHSRVKKHIIVVACLATDDETASGDRTYPLPDGWDDGFSDYNYRVEYPLNSEDPWPTILPTNMVTIWNAQKAVEGTTGQQTSFSGKRLRFLETMLSNRTPQKGDQFNVHFQVRWVIADADTAADGIVTTVPDSDFWPVCYLTASQACLAIASQYAQNVDSSLSADSANYRDKAAQFTALAKSWMDRYKQAVVPPTDELRPFGVLGEFEQDDFNRTQYPFYWRDESDLKNTDR